MATRPAKHPTAEILMAFGLGKLDESSSGALLAHLDLCVDCRKIVASQSGDDFLDRIRQAHSRNATPAPPKSLGGMEGKPKPPPGPTTLFNLPPELADNPQYEILKELGRGGMGVVYLAKNKLMDRLEVLKVINKALLDRPGAIERFLREIRAAAKLNHVNVVAAYSALQLGELLVFAMEYVEGQDLADVVKANGPLPVAHACFYVQQAAQGLQHAFEKKMVHRDIKPQNLILAREGRKHLVKILDFGLAKVMLEKSDDTGLTGEGMMLGTPDYMAPEQTLDATSADIRADIYSLGCTLYFLLSGKRPFKGKNLFEILQAHQSLEAPALIAIRSEVPAELAAVVRKMMVKDRAWRFQTPLEVVLALKPFVRQVAASKSSPGLSVAEAPAAVPLAKIVTPSIPSASGNQPPPPLPASRSAVAWDSLTDSVIAATPSGRSGARTAAQSASRTGGLIAGSLAASLLLLGLLGYWLAAVLFRVETPNGTLVVEINDNEVEARIKNGKLILSGPDGKVRYTLSPNDRRKQLDAGAYQIRVEGADGLVLDTPKFTLKKGGQVKVRVTMAPKAVVKNTPASLDPDRNAAEWVLSRGGTVRVSLLGKEKVIGPAETLPAEKFEILEINLNGKKVGEGGLARLEGLTNLRRLDLAGAKQVTDAGLIHFKSLPRLTVLVLNETGVSDAGLEHLKGLTTLRELDLFHNRAVTDAGLATLKELTNLEALDLNYTRVTDAGLIHLEGLTKLRWLNLMQIEVTGAGLVHIKNLANLQGLDFYGSTLGDIGLDNLKGMSQLASIRLDYTRVSGAGLIHLKGLTNLTSLTLGGLNISDAELRQLHDLKQLKHLDLTRTKVTIAGIAAIQKALPGCRILPEDKGLPVLAAILGGGPVSKGQIWFVKFSADGRWLASANLDSTAILWDTTTKRERRILRGHSGKVTAVAFSKDGRTLVSASFDGTLKLWSTETDAKPETLQTGLGEIWSMTTSEDGRFLAASDKNGALKLWKWGQWDKPTTLTTLPGWVWAMTFSPDGEVLASGWADSQPRGGVIRLYKTADGQLTHTMSGHPEGNRGATRRMAFRRDGKQLISIGTDNKVRIWELASGKLVAELTHGFYHGASVSISPDSKTVAVGSRDKVDIFDLPARQLKGSIATIPGSRDIFGLDFSPDGKYLAVGDETGNVLLYGISRKIRKSP